MWSFVPISSSRMSVLAVARQACNEKVLSHPIVHSASRQDCRVMGLFWTEPGNRSECCPVTSFNSRNSATDCRDSGTICGVRIFTRLDGIVHVGPYSFCLPSKSNSVHGADINSTGRTNVSSKSRIPIVVFREPSLSKSAHSWRIWRAASGVLWRVLCRTGSMSINSHNSSVLTNRCVFAYFNAARIHILHSLDVADLRCVTAIWSRTLRMSEAVKSARAMSPMCGKTSLCRKSCTRWRCLLSSGYVLAIHAFTNNRTDHSELAAFLCFSAPAGARTEPRVAPWRLRRVGQEGTRVQLSERWRGFFRHEIGTA